MNLIINVFHHGGTTGQVLIKNSDEDNDVEWDDKSNFIVVGLNSNVSLGFGSNYITFDKVFDSNGGKISLKGNRIYIAENVKHVKVSGSIYISNYSDETKSISLDIMKTSNYETDSMISKTYTRNKNHTYLTIPTKIFSVSKGDYINMSISAANEDVLNSHDNATYMCVEVVD